MNLAKVWNLPAIFVFEDNGYAESTGQLLGVSRAIWSSAARPTACPSRRVDGHDFFEVWDAAREAIERARDGEGPSVLHVKLMRYYGHFEGDAMTYRAPGEIDKLKAEKDCLEAVPPAGHRGGAARGRPARRRSTRRRGSVIDQALAAAKAAPAPTEADLLTDVYASY